MKLKNILIALVVAPIIAYVVTQVLWIPFPYIPLSISAYSDITTYSGLGVFGLIVYLGLRSGLKQKKHLNKKVKSPISLDKDITLKDVSETLRPSKKSPLLEFIIIGAGKNLHQVVPYNPTAEYKVGETVFKVENENLLIKQAPFGRKKLVAIFTKEGEAIKIKDSNTKITAEILSLAQRSTALGRTIKEMFTTHLDLKKILFFVIIGAVVVVVVLVLLGGGIF